MRSTSARFVLCLLFVGAALFIFVSASLLPGTVASHFSASGAADGYMPRDSYRLLMLLVALGVPLAILLLQGLAGRGLARIPNAQYWLAPDRKAATIAFIDRQAIAFALLLLLFLCFVHWLVVRANAVQPPRLESELFLPALIVYLVVSAIWLCASYFRFRRPR